VSLADDAARLAAAARTSPDERIPALAARLFGVPAALVLPAGADPADIASRDGYRFYAAAPLTASDGRDLGTLCVLGEEPRAVSQEDTTLLADLAALLVDKLEAESLASALQASLLPPRPPQLPGMELATRYEAASGLVVGGDFYDVFRLARHDWAIVVGDVCGHGARAAALTGLARWTVRAAAVHHFSPAETLAELNAALLGAARTDDDDTGFATAVLARLELDICGAWLTLCCAGHPRPVVVRKAGWIDVRGQSGTPVGMFDEAALEDDRVGLGPGDALVFFTDGITEARGANGEMFADEALPTVLLESAGLPADRVAENVLAALRAFAPGTPHDDRALVVVRVPEDAKEDSIRRVSAATGIPPEELTAPRYPVGEAPARRIPAPPREARIKLTGGTESVAGARAFLTRLLASWRMDALLEDGDVVLLASELATNAIFHGVSPVTVIARYDGAVVRVEVGDGSRELPAPRDARDSDEGGRGMHLVEALSSGWGSLPTREGKRVWFEVPAPPPG
jgi:sigma-B regulation protein RsbU (phosphoserine phosphatase)